MVGGDLPDLYKVEISSLYGSRFIDGRGIQKALSEGKLKKQGYKEKL
jgi:hypothetical protein